MAKLVVDAGDFRKANGRTSGETKPNVRCPLQWACSGTPLAPRPMMDSHSITRCGCSIPLIGTRSAGSCAPLTGFVGVLERHHSVSRVPRSGRRIRRSSIRCSRAR
jgi:hypothetical protein